MKRIMKLTILLFLAAVFAVADSFSLTYYAQVNVDPRTQPFSTDWATASGIQAAPAIQCTCIVTDLDVYVDPYSGTETSITNTSTWQAVSPQAAFIIGVPLPDATLGFCHEIVEGTSKTWLPSVPDLKTMLPLPGLASSIDLNWTYLGIVYNRGDEWDTFCDHTQFEVNPRTSIAPC